MYGCESWTIKKAEHRRIDAFELWCWRILSRVPWTARSLNQSTLKEIIPESTFEGLMLIVNLQYFGTLIQRADSLKKTLKMGKIQGKRRRWWQSMRWLDSIIDSVQFSRSVVSDPLWPHKPHYTRTPCPSPIPGVHPNPCPLSRWCHPLSSTSPPALNVSQYQGLFQWVSSSHQVAKLLEFQLQHQSFQWTPRTNLF